MCVNLTLVHFDTYHKACLLSLNARSYHTGSLTLGILLDAGGGKDNKNKGTGKKDARGKGTRDNKDKNRKPPKYRELIDGLLKLPKYRQAARAFAKKYARFNQATQISAMASRVEQILTEKH